MGLRDALNGPTKVQRLLKGLPVAAALGPVLRDPFFHLRVKGLGGGNVDLSSRHGRSPGKGEGALSAPRSTEDKDDAAHSGHTLHESKKIPKDRRLWGLHPF